MYQRTKHVETKYQFQRQLLLEGILRYQHQATHVQIADMMTKDLPKKVHKLHRDVVFGSKPIIIESHKLPESQKVYMRRHNEELARKVKELKIAQQFKRDDAIANDICAMHNRQIAQHVQCAHICKHALQKYTKKYCPGRN